MRKFYSGLLLLAAGVLFAGKLSAQISVTASAGTPTGSYTSLKLAFDAINAGTHQGNIQISVTGSTTEPAAAVLNGTTIAPANYSSVVIKPATGVNATISGNVAAGATIKFNGADNVTIDGSNTVGGTTRNLTITNTTATAPNAEIWIGSPSAADGSNNNTIKNCIISGTSLSTSTAAVLSGSAVILGNPGLTSNSGNTLQNNLMINNQQATFISGIASSPFESGWSITGNTINNMGVRGLLMQNVGNFNISNNTVSGIGTNLFTQALGISVGQGALNGFVSNNTITNIANTAGGTSGSIGISLSITSPGSNVNVYNNYISNVSTNLGSGFGTGMADNAYGIYVINPGTGIGIYYNTIVMNVNQTTGFVSPGIMVNTGATAAVSIRNNNIVNTQTAGATNRVAIWSNSPATAFAAIDNNNYFSTSGVLGNIGGVPRNTIADMITGFGGNTSSVSLNPTFVSPTDFHLQSVFANQGLRRGVTITLPPPITTDFDGNTRATVSVLGADETYLPSQITYTPAIASCGNNNNILSGVNIQDATITGISTSGANVPRIYFRKNSGAWFSNAGTFVSGTINNSNWDFTISATAMGGVNAGDVIQYYVIAENNSGVVTSFPSAGLVATGVNSVSTPPTTPSSYTVSPLPTATIGATPNPTCVGTPLNFTATGVAGTGTLISYNWSGPNSYSTTTTTSTTSLTPSTTLATGQYTLTVTYPGLSCTSNPSTANVTVNAPLSAITGTGTVCVAGTTSLTNPTGGGTWSSGNTSIATVGVTTGVVTGVLAGTADITYRVGACISTTTVTVNPLPVAIAGTLGVCEGLTTALSNATALPAGTWASSNIAVATVPGAASTSATVTGVAAGTSRISYILPTGCATSSVLTVNGLPSSITGANNVCEGANITLASSPAGGTWSSSNTAVGTVGLTTGVVTGIAAGTTEITYTRTNTCIRTYVVSVNTTPTVTSTPAAATVCIGSTIPLTGTPATGTWSTSGIFASVGLTTGVVTGVNTATAGTTITYTLPTGCRSFKTVTVNTTPGISSAVTPICEGGTQTYVSGLSGGVWSSQDPAVADITPATGFLTGLTPGTSTISYTMPTGCFVTRVATVNANPAPITGSSEVCVAGTTTLSSSPAGTWASSFISRATVNTAGVVSGVTAGTVNITYTVTYPGSNQCRTVFPMTVNPQPATITGTFITCPGSITTLASATAGGTWSSNNTSVADVAVATIGEISGIAAGTATISYTAPVTGCVRTAVITVNPLPASVSGTLVACPGTTTTLTTASTGGAWYSSNTSVATVTGLGGVVTAVSAGTAIISYRLSATGCSQSVIFTVNPAPGLISPPANVCVGATATFTSALATSWSSSAPAIGAINATTGEFTGNSVGTVTITAATADGCTVSRIVSVNTTPSPLTGTMVVCEGSTTNLTAIPGGGTWSSSDVAFATVTTASPAVGPSTGVVAGVTMGTANITYTLGGSSGCFAVATVTVNERPLPIAGISAVCVGATVDLDNITPGGTWSVGSTLVASIDPATGVLTGLSSGTSIVSYTLTSTGCAITRVATVNPIPNTITGGSIVCVGSSLGLGTSPGGGTWSSSDATIASILSTGVVTGTGVGVANISYILPTGCFRINTVTVNATPTAIAGPDSVCVGSGITLSSSAGGTWSVAFPSVASISSVSATDGLLTGLAAGTTRVSYTSTFGCAVAKVVTVLALPGTISGATVLCENANTTLASLPVGGTWSSATPTVVSVVPGTGFATAGVAGTAVVSYTNVAGCSRTAVLTVNPLPAAITGAATPVCIGATLSLTSAPTGGTWFTSAPAIAAVNAFTGVVTGNAAGTATISYRLASGCQITQVVTVSPAPGPVTGVASICVGANTTLIPPAAGGAWLSGSPAIATVDAAGVVTGVAAGTANISYTSVPGCIAVRVVTVNAIPGAIGGSLSVCSGASSPLTNSSSPGTWSSSNTTVGTINGATGVFTAITAGNTNITFTSAAGCASVSVATVNPLPSAITGFASVCSGNTTTLSSTTPSGVWTSANLSVATVDPVTGVVTAVNAGNSTISYTSAGCSATRVVTVLQTPAAIGGLSTVCQGGSIVLSSTPGGTWSSTTASVGTIATTTGVFTGISAGVTTVSYTSANGCFRTTAITVDPIATLTSGPAIACVGQTTTLAYSITGGSFTTASAAIATVGLATGDVTGVSAGIVNITYTLPSGCRTITPVTVNAQPETITGSAVICLGSSTTLSSSTPGVNWSTADATIATVGATSGIVVGIGVGTTSIIATNSLTGCARATTVTVNALPAAITGTGSFCVGNSSALASLPIGGTWSSNATSIATVGLTSGVATGVSSGTATITYRLPTGCVTTRVVTVLPQPVAITGVATVCVSGQTTYFTPTTGGTWSSSNTAIADVNTTGVITGMSPGIANITYQLATSCFVTKTVTVLPTVSPIAGVTSVCQGSTTGLSSLTPGGTWSTSDLFVASVTATSGVVSGLSAGSAVITYTAPSGCTDTAVVVVNPVPAAIGGIANICLGSVSTLTSLTPGGSWSSGNPIVATVGATTGDVTGITVGTARITYTLGTGCRATQVVTVSSLPAPITGFPQVCEGATTTLGSGTIGGTWSSSSESIATVTATGVVNGVASGTSTISYTLPSGCARTAEVTVNATPNPISGIAYTCLGATTTLNGTPAGGAFTSSHLSVAAIDVASGVLTGLSVGTSLITYSLPSGCRTFVVATVHPLPSAITGVTNICQGGTTTLTNAVAGGIWSSDFLSIATIEPATGIVTGVAPGVDTIRYTLVGGCSTKITLTVNVAPGAITGNFNLCLGSSTTLIPPTGGGTWTTSNPSVATIGLSSGVVSTHSAGSAIVTYALGAGCRTIQTIVVNPSPSAITGSSEVCVGQSTMLFNTVSGGTWSSDDVSVAPVVATTGEVSGIATGVATIKYELPGGCTAEFIVTVNPLPDVVVGVDSICQGESVTFTNATSGGIWTSSAPAIAPVNLTTGLVSGVSVGTAAISYTLLGTGCYRVKSVSVNPAPAAIGGVPTVCVGSTTLLTNTTPGGVWSTLNSSVAMVGSITGLVQGMSADTVSVLYTVPTGCKSTIIVAVNPLPDNIVGSADICVGSTTTFTSATPFGSWSSSVPSVASINPGTGVVTGVAAGTSTITYTLFATGCYVIKQVTVNPLPPAIAGVQYMCLGTTAFVSNPIPGGTWSSSVPTTVDVDAFGNVTALAVGSSTITYTLGTACYITRPITVEPTLNAITGPSSVCEGSNITLSNSFAGGNWSSSTPSIATVGSTGIVTGVVTGVATITYETPLANCFTVTSVTVDPVPAAIAGGTDVCVGATVTLSNTTPGGTWSTSDAAIASVDASGVVTGVSANSVLISYTVGSGCTTTLPFTVKPLSNAGTISGSAEVCVDATTTIVSSGDAGGTWLSSNPLVATIGSASGVVTGVTIGTVIMSYITANDCSLDTATFSMLVKAAPDAGTLTAGSAGLCIGYNTTVTSTIAGGVWTSSNTSVATINAAGVVNALAAGTATISYTVTNDCGTDIATLIITVYNLAPNTAIAIHPDSVLCANTQYRNFGAALPPAAGISYEWSAVNAEVYAQSAGGRQNALISFPYAGTAVVRLTTQITSTGCFVVDSFTATIKTDSAFTPDVKYYAGELICTDNEATSYQWGYDDAVTLDSTAIRGAYQQAYYLPNPDFANKRYWVIVNHGGCYQKVYYNIPTSATTVVNGLEVRLFPNPANSRLNVEIQGITGNDDVTIRVVDMLGREVHTGALHNGRASVDVNSLAPGMYSVLFLNNGVKVMARNFVKN
jgi:uncharacterized protein YjdB